MKHNPGWKNITYPWKFTLNVKGKIVNEISNPCQNPPGQIPGDAAEDAAF